MSLHSREALSNLWEPFSFLTFSVYGINKTRTAEQSITVLPHGIMHFSSIAALDWGSDVFFSLLSLEHYRPLRNSPSQEQRSLAIQKGRKVAKTARRPLTWKYKKSIYKNIE